MSVQRLEDKLDLLSRGNSEWRTSSPRKSTSVVRGRPPSSRRSRSRGDKSEPSGEGSKKAKAAAEKETVNRRKATSDNRSDISEQPKAIDSALDTDIPMEAILSMRRQEVVVQDASINPSHSPVTMQSSLETRIGDINMKLEKIAVAVGVKVESHEGDDEEDRRRLKEKLKIAIELDRRTRVRTIVSKSEVWLEYIFGICPPDKRVGKRGSRYFQVTQAAMPQHLLYDRSKLLMKLFLICFSGSSTPDLGFRQVIYNLAKGISACTLHSLKYGMFDHFCSTISSVLTKRV